MGMAKNTGSPPAPMALPNYKMAERLGQGAFGSVYKAFNFTTGETVAVKQIGLSNIPKSDLPDIMAEIDLLKNLNHPNIVQYRGFVTTEEYLYIILEYCENGSLHNTTKKFGQFPESLVALYILQVLQGLLYLHDQGVIHRDIKGSNILATKEGSVKLADFGVATHAGGPSDLSVVGSPYWIAPEIIEQLGATTASDIWSLGALVVELLTGKPPYYSLDPMPALFRIVNDDCPPIPETASPVARDFLLQCFQKDSNLRVSARKLLRHPWMVSARKQADQSKREQLSRTPKPVGCSDNDLPDIQASGGDLEPFRIHTKTVDAQERTAPKQSTILPSILKNVNNSKQAGRLSLPIPKPSLSHAQDLKDDVWDNDFDDSISVSKLKGLDLGSDSEEVEDQQDENQKTIRPSTRPKDFMRREYLAPVVEDYSDLVGEDENDPFQGRVANLREQNTARRRILHPNDLSASNTAISPSPLPRRQSHLGSSRSAGEISGSTGSGQRTRLTETVMSRHREKENSADYSDIFGSTEINLGRLSKLRVQSQLPSKSSNQLGDDGSDEDDPFAEVDETTFEMDDYNSIAAKDKTAHLLARVNSLIEALSFNASDHVVNLSSVELFELLDTFPEVKSHFTKSHGLIAVIEVLQVARSEEATCVLLKIVNSIVTGDADALESLCLLGGCPILLSFAGSRYSSEIRLETALFISEMCQASLLSLQIFISCRGFKTLVDLVDEHYTERKNLVWIAVDGISSVFDLQGSIPRNDFCRIFAFEGLLDSLSRALLEAAQDRDDLAITSRRKMVQILLFFAQADKKVKELMASRAVVSRLIKATEFLEDDLLALLLKGLKSLSMLPVALDILHNSNAIKTFIKILEKQGDGKYSAEIRNHTVNALFNLCRLSKKRQDEAACAGAIPILQNLVRASSPLKQFALPILCDFAHSSKTSRRLLWKYDGLSFYLTLLADPYWANPSLEAILAWLQDETGQVEDFLLSKNAIESILHMFCTAKGVTFESLLDPLHKLLRTSSAICLRLVASSSFFKRILDRLSKASKAVVRLNLLRITKVVFDSLSNRRDKLYRTPNLIQIILHLADEDPAILVRELAKELAKDMEKARFEAQSRRVHASSLLRRNNSATINSFPTSSLGRGKLYIRRDDS